MSAGGKVALARDATAESLCAGDQEATYGIFAAVAYPPPENLQRVFSGFATSLSGAFAALGVPATSYLLYAPAALHSSVATAYHFCRGAPVSEAAVEGAWDALLGEATSMAAWPAAGEVAVVGARIDDGGAGILVVEDRSGCVEGMRACLRAAAGEREAHGVVGDVELRVPEIYHMTVLRWRTGEEFEGGMEKALYDDVCRRFAACWAEIEEVVVRVDGLATIRERLPYMYGAGSEGEKPKVVKFTEL